MNKFKVGDKVVRLPQVGDSLFARIQGNKDYYVVTSISNWCSFVQLDGVTYLDDPHPWYFNNFELYQEPEDEELPPAPKSVYYPDMFTIMTGHKAVGGTAGITVRQSPYQDDAVSVSVDGSKWSRLDADAALQLAHDLRRMAMDIRRKEKASEI